MSSSEEPESRDFAVPTYGEPARVPPEPVGEQSPYSLLLPRGLQQEIDSFRWAHRFDTKAAAIRALIRAGLDKWPGVENNDE